MAQTKEADTIVETPATLTEKIMLIQRRLRDNQAHLLTGDEKNLIRIAMIDYLIEHPFQ